MELESVGQPAPTAPKSVGEASSTAPKSVGEWRALVGRALGRAGLSQKAAAIDLGITPQALSKQLAGAEHLSFWRMFNLPPEFWRELVALIGRAIGHQRHVVRIPPASGYLFSRVLGSFLGDVIIKVDDKKITDYDELATAMEKYKIGDTVELTYLRGKRERTAKITLQPVGE